MQRLFFRAQNASVLGKCARFFYGRMSGNWRFPERFLQNCAARLLHHGSCARIPVVSLFFFYIPRLPCPLWFPSSFFFFPPVVFLSLVILLLPCIPCLSPASSHPPIHSLIRLHGYPFAITDNRLTGPHTLRYAITRK